MLLLLGCWVVAVAAGSANLILAAIKQ